MSPAASGAPSTDLASARRSELDTAWRQFASAASPEAFCRSWLEVQCQLIGGVHLALVVLQKPGVETFAPLAYWPLESRRERSALNEAVERALQQGRGLVEQRAQDCVLAYPVRVDGRVRGVVGVEIAARDELQLHSAMRQLQWGAGWLEVMLRRHADPMDTARARVKVLLQLVATFVMQGDFRSAATALVTEVATQLGCDRVALGSVERGRVVLEAVSHASQFDRHANLLVATINAMTEALDQREPIVYPPDRDGRLAVTQSHAELAQLSGAGSIATFPLASAGRQIGALTLERAQGAFDAPTVELLEGFAAMLGPLLDLQRARHQSLPAHATQKALEFRAKLVGPRHGGLKITLGVLAIAGLFLAFADGTYRIAADARIEGEIQRAVTAPFPGYVREAAARAGDSVKQGQLLARLDDRDLRVERARLAAQREQLSQQYRDAMAKQERAQVRIVSAQMAQADAQAELVDEQLARTEVTAPFDGVVVTGDLTQSLGAPLERGQVMFEVAPLDAYRIVLQVSEQDIADLKLGQAGELALTPMPGQRYALKVAKITPVSTPKDGRNVFRVEAQLATAADGRLRPGMEGVAKIEVGERRLAWIWTRRMVDWLTLKLWSWTP